jgi:hypothetical protein
MRNDRQIENQRIKEALEIFAYVCERSDLAGGCYVIDEKEMGFTYWMPATWNAFIADASLELGFRIRAKQDELGPERAKEFIEGAAYVIGCMQQFGLQTRLWGQDLQKLMEEHGKMAIQHNWPKIPRLAGFKPK